jgi:hypothetical protein
LIYFLKEKTLKNNRYDNHKHYLGGVSKKKLFKTKKIIFLKTLIQRWGQTLPW